MCGGPEEATNLSVNSRVSSDPVLRIVQQAVAHALRHVDAVQKDAERLEKKTGCCLPVVGEWQAYSRL